jgi:hypothetical protein
MDTGGGIPVWQDALRTVLLQPRAQQRERLRALLASVVEEAPEEWNTAFSPDSLYEAWGQLPLLQGLYAANRDALRALLDSRSDWHIVEVGGGNGALWRGFLSPDARGTLTLIDPIVGSHTAVAAAIPTDVTLHSIVSKVEEAEIPEADAIVCSLTLHHVAGRDAEQRQAHGLSGTGKMEILRRFVAALKARRGIGILNEADVYNEIDLPPGDPTLADHFIDVYVRRCAMAVVDALETVDADAPMRQRWEAIIRHWCIEQVEQCSVPTALRDVYELDVARWLELFRRAGATVRAHHYTDSWYLFHQYVFTADVPGRH